MTHAPQNASYVRPGTEDTAPQEETAAAATAADPAGTLSLTRRNRACARARALAGLTLGSGAVLLLNSPQTSVSLPL